MASKSGNPVTTVYQCSECDHCSQNLEEATLHAVHAHGDENDDSADESFQHRVSIKTDKDLCSSDEEYSHKYFNGESDAKRKLSWTNEATEALVLSVQENYEKLTSRDFKRKPIWQQIKTAVQQEFPSVTAFQCEQKWKVLLSAYKKYISSSKKGGGKARLKKPNFFFEINEFVGADSEHYEGQPDSSSLGEDKLSPILSQDESQSFLSSELSEGSSPGLARLLSVLERRERANEVFQKRMLAIEKEKLLCAQKFIEDRQKFNDERLRLMKNWMIDQDCVKRRKHD